MNTEDVLRRLAQHVLQLYYDPARGWDRWYSQQKAKAHIQKDQEMVLHLFPDGPERRHLLRKLEANERVINDPQMSWGIPS